MKIEEAIKSLKSLKSFHNGSYGTALDLAIKALEQEPCEDAISREAVHDLIATWLSDYLLDDTREVLEVIDEKVEDLPSVTPEIRWIPCSERLPKSDEYVGDVAKYYLVQNEFGDMLVARYTHSGYWEQIYQLKPIGDEVIAWRELPTPYKAEGSDEE